MGIEKGILTMPFFMKIGAPKTIRTSGKPALGVQSPCESLIKSVQFRAFRCIFIKIVRVFI